MHQRMMRILCIFREFAVMMYNPVFQSAVIRTVPSGTAVAMSVCSGICNVGIGWAGGAIAALGVLFCFLRVIPVYRKVFAKA